MLVLALLAPVVLLAGVLLAQAAQPAGTYDPIGQTVSTLAGRGGTDRWLMVGALLGLGVIYLLVALGLRVVSRVGGLVVGVGGVALLGVALAPQPVHGSSAVHMTWMVLGCLAFVLWPLALVVDRCVDPRLRRGSVAATVVLLGALGWFCAQAWTDGTWLGVAERVLLLLETVWPAWVVAASRRAPVDRRPTGDGRTTPVLAALAPVVLVGGLLAAESRQPDYDPVRQSVSTLSGGSATDRWIAVTTLLVLGGLYLLVAAGLRRLPRPPRVLLGLAGAMVLVAAVAAQPAGGSSLVHMVSATVSWAAFVTWPVALACSRGVDPQLRWTSLLASGVLVVLLGWFAVELVTDGGLLGLVQRVVLVAQTVWPLRVAAGAVRARESPVEPSGATAPAPSRSAR